MKKITIKEYISDLINTNYGLYPIRDYLLANKININDLSIQQIRDIFALPQFITQRCNIFGAPANIAINALLKVKIFKAYVYISKYAFGLYYIFLTQNIYTGFTNTIVKNTKNKYCTYLSYRDGNFYRRLYDKHILIFKTKNQLKKYVLDKKQALIKKKINDLKIYKNNLFKSINLKFEQMEDL